MKRNIIHTLWTAAVLLPIACTQEELPLVTDGGNAQTFTITVTDGGYASTDKVATRAAENGYRIEFTAGDECGLYIVRGGKVVYENIKLTATASANGNALTWQSEADVILAGGFPDESWFLYYPYLADMSGKTDASATDAEDFFAPLVSGWHPKADQSTYAGYTASDLMTANGTAAKDGGNLKLTFSMTHCMALAVIEMPKTVYKFTNTDVSIPDYTAASSADFTLSSVKPYAIAPGTYRCIVNPAGSAAASIIGSYDNGMKEFTIAPNALVAGKYKTYKVDGAQTVQKNHDLQPGDYLMKDGGLLPKGTSLNDAQKANVSAIVFHAGQHPNDQSDYTLSGIGQKKCHGYALALTDATNDCCMWGVPERGLGCCPIDNSGNKQDNFHNHDIDWSGYAWTRQIIGFAGGKDKLNATEQAGYPASWYAVVAYETGSSAPSNSSGWFLPSIGQMWKIYQNRSSLFGSVSGAEGLKTDWYWSSSEYYYNPADDVLCVSVLSGIVLISGKERSNGHVRPVLAF